MRKIAVAIDGPNGAGKSTIARKLAERLGCIYVDTGALYRAVGLCVKRRGADPDSDTAVIETLPYAEVDLEYSGGEQRVLLNGEDVTGMIRTPEISVYASKVSKIPKVREKLLEIQRGLAERSSVIMDGRDIGTVILPNADVKIFLTASPEIRAERRFKELRAAGSDVSYEDVLKDLIWRDKNDSERDIAPLRIAEDAVALDTSRFDLEASIDAAYNIVLHRSVMRGRSER